MPEYQFVSKDLSGKTYAGTLEAENLNTFYRILSDRNQFCVSVHQAGAASKPIGVSKRKLKLKELAVFSRQFSTMLSSGLTVIKCLDILYQQAEGKFLREVILRVYESVQKGESLSRAMKAQGAAFPSLFLSMIESGEASGSLENVLERMADQFDKDSKMKNRITQALIYPIVLVILIILVVIFMLVFILPQFNVMFEQFNATLPLPTKILLAISGAIINYWYIMIAVIAIIAFLWKYYLKSESGRLWWDRLKTRFPIAGKLLLIIISSRFARTLATLFSSGMPIVQALEIVGSVLGNKFAETKIADICDDVRRGIALSVAVNRAGIFPPMLCSMIKIGEESGNLDNILVKTSTYYDEDSSNAIQKLISLIEPILIVFLAFIVGFIVISIILPIFSIYNAAGS